MKSFFVLSALLAAQPALAANLALMAATRGHVSANQPAQQAARTGSGICLWQVPGAMKWVNLYAMVSLTVGENRGGYMTIINFGGGTSYNRVEVDIPKGTEVSMHTGAILRRIDECQK